MSSVFPGGWGRRENMEQPLTVVGNVADITDEGALGWQASARLKKRAV